MPRVVSAKIPSQNQDSGPWRAFEATVGSAITLHPPYFWYRKRCVAQSVCHFFKITLTLAGSAGIFFTKTVFAGVFTVFTTGFLVVGTAVTFTAL